MRAIKSVGLQFSLPLLFVATLPFFWADSGASRLWELFPVPEGFERRLALPTYLLVTVIAAQAWLLRWKVPLAQSAEHVFRPRWNFWFWFALLGVFLWRAFEYQDVFPVHHKG